MVTIADYKILLFRCHFCAGVGEAIRDNKMGEGHSHEIKFFRTYFLQPGKICQHPKEYEKFYTTFKHKYIFYFLI